MSISQMAPGATMVRSQSVFFLPALPMTGLRAA